MGGEAWSYTTRYQPDIANALNELQQREFAAGRYGGLFWKLMGFFPIGDQTNAPAPGPRHGTIGELLEEAQTQQDETRSILDMRGISKAPRELFISPLSNSELMNYFGTLHPTLEQVRTNQAFEQSVSRGTGRSVVTYVNELPDQILFYGCCID